MTKTALKTLSDQTFIDNTAKAITPEKHRHFNNELIDSIPEVAPADFDNETEHEIIGEKFDGKVVYGRRLSLDFTGISAVAVPMPPVAVINLAGVVKYPDIHDSTLFHYSMLPTPFVMGQLDARLLVQYFYDEKGLGFFLLSNGDLHALPANTILHIYIKYIKL